MATIRVELLFTPECPHRERAEALLRRVLDAEAVTATIDRVPVADLDHAAGLGFGGSPTIRLDGVDVAPRDGDIGLGCRTFLQPDGSVQELPSEAELRAAVRASVAAQAPRPGAMARLGALPAGGMRAAFLWASRRRSLERLTRAFPPTRSMVQRFVAGEDLPAALPVLRRLRDTGFGTTVDLLGESVTSPSAATAAADAYLRLLDALRDEHLDGNVSLKLTQMGLDVDHELCLRNVARVVEHARATDAFVRLDMEDHTRTDATLAIGRELHSRYGNVGVVIQSYLRRSEADVEALIADGIRVRLCKGAYNEPASVAYETKAEVDESFVRLAERLLKAGVYPGIATHDERIIDHVLRFADRERIGPERYEMQMLFGVRRDLQERLVGEGTTVRVYVPTGSEWYPYFMRRLAERPANVLFLLRNLMRERRGRSD